MRCAILAVVVCNIAMPSAARAENCGQYETTIDINECASRNYQAADKELNEAFERAIANAKASDRDVQGVDYSYEAALRKAQRAWMAFRDSDCAQPPRPLSGTMDTMQELLCLQDRTIERTKELDPRALGN